MHLINRHSFLVILYMVFSLLGCGSKEDVDNQQLPVENGYMTLLTEKNVTVKSIGGSVKISFDTDMSIVMVLPSVDWVRKSLKMSSTPDTFYLEVDSNSTADNRTTDITFVSPSNTQIITILQLGKNMISSVEELQVSYKSQTVDIEVSSNTDFNTEVSADWLRFSGEQTKAFETRILQFILDENESTIPREAFVYLRGSEVSQKIRIYQKERRERIRLEMCHNDTVFNVPVFLGDSLEGHVFWDDGSVTEYTTDLSYSYESNNNHKVILEVRGSESFMISQIGTLSEMMIFIDKEKQIGVEDGNIEHKDWN